MLEQPSYYIPTQAYQQCLECWLKSQLEKNELFATHLKRFQIIKQAILRKNDNFQQK